MKAFVSGVIWSYKSIKKISNIWTQSEKNVTLLLLFVNIYVEIDIVYDLG